MSPIDADAIVADVRERLGAVQGLKEWCQEWGLSYWGCYNFLRRTEASASIHWLARVDEALRETGR